MQMLHEDAAITSMFKESTLWCSFSRKIVQTTLSLELREYIS